MYGDNTNAGTQDAPLKTITYALQLARNNTTTVIEIGPGHYSPSTNGETFPLTIKNNTHLIGFSMDSTIIDANATGENQEESLKFMMEYEMNGLLIIF